MNKRIIELMNEANKTAGFTFSMDQAKSVHDLMEKFAELILQDIEKIVDDLYHVMPLEQAAVLLTLDENIKERFYGIEK